MSRDFFADEDVRLMGNLLTDKFKGNPGFRIKSGMTTRDRLTVCLLTLFIFAITSSVSYAADPTKYIENSFESPLFSGYFDYDYKINVPPGTDGLAPKLSMSYNSHAARRAAGWVGAGWEIPLSYIQRNTDGSFDLILDGARSPLVYSTADKLFVEIRNTETK